jgi:hypothetical protein
VRNPSLNRLSMLELHGYTTQYRLAGAEGKHGNRRLAHVVIPIPQLRERNLALEHTKYEIPRFARNYRPGKPPPVA